MECMTEFDFSAWSALAESDPERFELYRSEVIEQLIRGSGNDISRQRMKILAGQIEQFRNAGNDPHVVLTHLVSLINSRIEERLNIAVSQVKDMLQE